jgi:hypothetical protein
VSKAAYGVQASVQSVEPEIGVLSPQGALGNVNEFGQVARQAHDTIANATQAFAASGQSRSLGSAVAQTSAGASDLANALGALVAYNGNPSSATLSQFLEGYQNARSEWNSGIRAIWRIAGAGNPPTV